MIILKLIIQYFDLCVYTNGHAHIGSLIDMDRLLAIWTCMYQFTGSRVN